MTQGTDTFVSGKRYFYAIRLGFIKYPVVFRLGFIKMYYISPLAELHTAIALNATTNGRNHLKIEIFNFMSLSFPLHSTMLSGIRKFCDYLFAFQFLLESIIDMLTDSL